MKSTRATQRPRTSSLSTGKRPTSKKAPAPAPKRPATSRLLHDYIQDAIELPKKQRGRAPNLDGRGADPTVRNVDVNEHHRRTRELLFGPQH
jgi:hypothetical protein